MTFRADDLPTTLEAWNYVTPDDWRQAVWAATEPVWLAHPLREQLGDQLCALLEQHLSRAAGRELEKVTTDMTTLALQVGALMGYALARTWPPGIEDLDEWIARAAAFSGLDQAAPRDIPLAG